MGNLPFALHIRALFQNQHQINANSGLGLITKWFFHPTLPSSTITNAKGLIHSSREVFTTSLLYGDQHQHREPMIKFIGPRSPQPHFDSVSASVSLPPISSMKPEIDNSGSSSGSGPAKKGKVKYIDSIFDLPKELRRPDLESAEIEAINTGVFHLQRQ